MSTFGQELKAWRYRRGLSQLELAVRADVSQRHISFLETGRSNPSREMVLHLGMALDVPSREHNLLLLSAGHAPGFSESSLHDIPELAAVLQRMVDAHEPYMAFVVDRTWGIVASNPAAARFAVRAFDAPPTWAGSPPNIMRLNFHPEGLRRISSNWASTASALLRRLERDAAMFPNDEALRSLLAEVRAHPGVEGLSEQPRVTVPEDLLLTTRYEIGGESIELFSTIAVVGDAHDVTLQELRIETFWPVDVASDAAWRRLVA